MKFHDELNKKIWNEDNTLKSEVSEKLNEIANAFIDFLEIPKDSIQDIRILGSSASYNYTEHSDLDLHLVIDYEKVHEDCPLVNGYLWAYKSIFNNEHDISIYGIPVEVYAEPTTESAISNGVYSLTKNDWLKFPEKIEPTDNDSAVQLKYKELKEACDKCDDSEVAEKLYDKIYSMRKSGLAKGGEFSTENLAFKLLRNDGCLDKLRELKKANIDKELTLETYNKGEKMKRKRINEEYGEFKDYPEIEYIADKIESGNLQGYEPYMFGNWTLSAFLDSEKDMLDPYEGLSDNLIDFFAREISYPVRDGHIFYNGLDIIINSGSGLTKEDLIELMDWTNHNYFNKSDINKMLKGGDEIEFWIDYNIEYDEDTESEDDIEESYKGTRKMKRKRINENETQNIIKKAIDDYIAKHGDTIEIYADYNDTLSDDTIKEIMENPEDAYEIIWNLYHDGGYYGDDEYDYLIQNELGFDEDFIDENIEEIRDMVYDYITVEPDYGHFLDTDVRVDVFPTISDDYAGNAYVFGDNGLEEVGDPIMFFLTSQGYTAEEFIKYYNAQTDFERGSGKTDVDTNSFLGSMVQELDNLANDGGAEPVLLGVINLQDYIKGDVKSITIPKNATCGIVDTYNGGGSVLDVSLEKPITLNKEDFKMYPYHSYKYNVDDTYGMVGSAWDNTDIKINSNTNESYKGTRKMKRRINEYRSKSSGVGLHKKVGTTNKDGVVNYRGTNVFTLRDGKAILNTGGYKTQTTKDRMNQALDEYGVGGEIKQIKGQWYYIKDGEKTPFEGDTLEISVNESYRGTRKMKKRINEEEKYLSDEDIAAQYEDFKCTYIKVEPSKVNDGWYDFTLELEFPDADHPDFNDYVIENGYYDSEADRWGFDNWYPEETSEKLKEMVLAEIEKVTPKEESLKPRRRKSVSEGKFDDEDMEYEYQVVRKNALANPNLYDGRYAQKSSKDARKEFKKDYKVWDKNTKSWVLKYPESYKPSRRRKSVNQLLEGNFEQQSTAYYDFCVYIKQIMSEGKTFEEAVEEAMDNTVYESDIINIWTNMPGSLTTRDGEIEDLMREDIYDGVMQDQDFIERLEESFKPRRRRKSVNEISDELVDKVTFKRAENTHKTHQEAMKSAMQNRPKYKRKKSVNILDGNLAGDYFTAAQKESRHLDLRRARDTRKETNIRRAAQQSESLSKSILRQAHNVLAMNESSETGDMTTWQFKASGFSKPMLEKQNSFGSSNIRCTIHENNNGKLVGTATVDYYMNKVEVEEALKNALRENGFKTVTISELTNLY